MKKEGSFTDLLKRQGYKVTEKKLGGGFVHDVKLITAHKGNETFGYVLKKFPTKNDATDMLRGYDSISDVVNTPAIVYQNGREVVYDLIKGSSIKDMIMNYDPKASEALRLLAKELEKLHKSKKVPLKYKKGNSPDERKMIEHVAESLNKNQISGEEANKILKQITNYIPKNKSLIHGDSHLGNFLYSNGKVYFIDPDNVKISDYNADIGKVIYEIKRLEEEGRISKTQATHLSELFLTQYNGEDANAVKMFSMRTPLIELKNRSTDIARRAINKLSKLEKKVAVFILVAISLIFLINRTPTGFVVGEGNTNFPIFALVLILAMIVYFISKKYLVKKK